MPVRVGINGFGRIGRAYLRCALQRDIQVVAINDVADVATLSYLFAHDSTHGGLALGVRHDERSILVDHDPIRVTSHAHPRELQWADFGVDVVIEATGRFLTRDAGEFHLKAGARKVIWAAPGEGADLTVVKGVNEGGYDAGVHHVVSASSCTTNCAAPMLRVLHSEFGVRKGFLTTVHAYTSDQRLLDGVHKDLRRGRSAAVNIVPTGTGAAGAVGMVIDELAGRLDGVALRVPVEDGSLTDLTVVLDRPVDAGEVNEAFRVAASGPMRGVLRFSTDELVSRDVVGDPASCVLDSLLTRADGELVEAFGWYDNETGYANRLADLTSYIGIESRGSND